MKKEKLFKIGVINNSIVDVVKDMTTFYTSDTELWLGFELNEENVDFDSAEILIFNIDDRSFVVRSVVKSDDKYWYELDMDIIGHHGQWKAQLQFTKNSEVYTSKHFNFRIENDLSNERPPKLVDITNWSNIKQTADSLIAEMKVAVTESIEAEQHREEIFAQAESERETYFEAVESERAETFENNETTRQAQELEREKAEAKRQTTFDENEADRIETFSTNEATRQESETTRQQAESERQASFETNESERQTTFDTAEQIRQSAELIRVENERQRNLTSVDEFTKLQNAIGGRNYLLNSDKPNSLTFQSNNSSVFPITRGVENGVDWFYQVYNDGREDFIISTYMAEYYSNKSLYGSKFSKDFEGYSGIATYSIDVMSEEAITIRIGLSSSYGFGKNVTLVPKQWTRLSVSIDLTKYDRPISLVADTKDNINVPAGTKVYWKNYKIEKGTQPTPYTKAPEDYAFVSKDDYYNHIKLVNDTKDSQFNQLKQAVIALGGTI